MLKGDHFEMVVEKTTELGINHIVPVISERTIKTGANVERLKKIAIEASEQSGRIDVPVIHEITKLKDAISEYVSRVGGEVFVLNEDGIKFDQIKTENKLKRNSSVTNRATGPVAILVGPEGGWSPTEIKHFKDSKFTFISLGKNVLRAETAAVVGVFGAVNL
jgi:16S rRNA (uracil1498-N3)-methyltransferase